MSSRTGWPSSYSNQTSSKTTPPDARFSDPAFGELEGPDDATRMARAARRDALLRWSPHLQGPRYLEILSGPLAVAARPLETQLGVGQQLHLHVDTAEIGLARRLRVADVRQARLDPALEQLRGDASARVELFVWGRTAFDFAGVTMRAGASVVDLSPLGTVPPQTHVVIDTGMPVASAKRRNCSMASA